MGLKLKNDVELTLASRGLAAAQAKLEEHIGETILAAAESSASSAPAAMVAYQARVWAMYLVRLQQAEGHLVKENA